MSAKRAALGGVSAALMASACCIGPVVFSLVGAGALGASAVALEPYRPWFIGATALMEGLAFYTAYRPLPAETCAEGACAAPSRRAARWLAWVSAVLAAVLLAFPYYIGWIV
jgi:mercuric ion transport protein